MAGWKTLDEATAKELEKHVSDGEIEVSGLPESLFQERSSVVVVPSAKKGVALVITGRRKSPQGIDAPIMVEPQTVVEEGSEFQIAPEIWDAAALDQGSEAPAAESAPTTAASEIVESCDAGAVEDPLVEARKIPKFDDAAPLESACEPQVDSPSEADREYPDREDHYVATGFLGLVDRIEGEEEAARENRPWWKRLFSD